MKANIGMKVQGYKSSCIGILIQASRWSISKDVTYTYWKTTSDGREIYRSDVE